MEVSRLKYIGESQTYAIKIKNSHEGIFTLKIYDLAENHFYKQKIKDPELKSLLAKGKEVELLNALKQKNHLPETYTPPKPPSVDKQKCLETLKNLQSEYTTSIVTFHDTPKNNQTLANKSIEIATLFVEEGDYKAALESYKEAFQYTRNPDHYASLPDLYLKMKDPQKARLAFLYLTTYYLQENQFPKALKTLENCQKSPATSPTLAPLVELLNPQPLSPMEANLENLCITEKVEHIIQENKAQTKHNRKLSEELLELRHKNKQHKQKLKELQNELLPLKKYFQKKQLKKLEKEQQIKELMQKGVYGKEAWETHFGAVGEVPPLPQDIEKILSSPCPFWPNKTVQETHLLVLIPETVNGKPLTLNLLQELIKAPKSGNKTEYRYYDKYVEEELGEQKAPASHWVLLTNDVIPGSRNKSYSAQKELMSKYPPYTLGNALDITAALLIHHVKTGGRLYTDNPNTYARCLERVNSNQWPVAIGYFSVGASVSTASTTTASTRTSV